MALKTNVNILSCSIPSHDVFHPLLFFMLLMGFPTEGVSWGGVHLGTLEVVMKPSKLPCFESQELTRPMAKV